MRLQSQRRSRLRRSAADGAAGLRYRGGGRGETVALVDGQTRHEITKPVTVLGRSAGCDVRLSDPNVSRRHAELRQQGTSYWMVDLDSTNGVEVNGGRVERAKLDHGDKVTLGETELVFTRELP